VRTVSLILAAAGLALGASAIMSWASNRSPLFNMAVGALLALGVLGGAILIALLLARAWLPR
jgi:hypothetical protein